MVNTRHIDKNGLSFDYPEYYDIGNFPDSDESYKSIVALSKQDRECELYVMVHYENTFDYSAKRNMGLLREYLKLKNYYNITINEKLPYCFNANVNYNGSNIKTKIAYDFSHNEVIVVVGNVVPFSDYDCIEDMNIILNSLQYFSDYYPTDHYAGPVTCSSCGFGYNNKLHNSCPNCGSEDGIPYIVEIKHTSSSSNSISNSSDSNDSWWILGVCCVGIFIIFLIFSIL